MLLDEVKYHGLRHDRDGRAGILEDQVAILSGGVFDEFVNVTAGFRLPTSARFRFKDVLSISPELANIYERYYGDKPRCIYLYDLQTEAGASVHLRLSPASRTADEVFASIPEIKRDFEAQPELHHGQAVAFVLKPNTGGIPEYVKEYAPMVGGRYIVGPLPFSVDGVASARYLLPPITDYVSMYILSDCVRYQQELWGEIVEGKRTGVLGMIELLLATSKRRFPNFILDHLFGEQFRYGSPSYLM